MKRLVQVLFVAAWVVGAVVGDLPQHPSASGTADESMHLLIETEHARLGADQRQIVLSVELPGQVEWRVTAPMPEILVPNRSEHSPRSQSELENQPSVITFII